MITSDTFIVSKAGYKFLFLSLVLFIVFTLFGWDFLKFLSLIALLLFVYIYRNPEREIPHLQKGAILSPVDGIVVAINTVDSGYEVVVKSSLFDSSILRSPFFSTVKSVHTRNGARLSADIRKSMLLNEKVGIDFEDNNKHIIHVEHISDNAIDNIKINLHNEYEISQGKRYGVMTKGKTVIRFPHACRLSLHVGDQLRAGESLLGYIS